MIVYHFQTAYLDHWCRTRINGRYVIKIHPTNENVQSGLSFYIDSRKVEIKKIKVHKMLL